MKHRKHASWQSDLDHGLMVFDQSGIYATYWFQRRKWINVRRELYYSRPDNTNLERFTLEQVAVTFLLLLGGMMEIWLSTPPSPAWKSLTVYKIILKNGPNYWKKIPKAWASQPKSKRWYLLFLH